MRKETPPTSPTPDAGATRPADVLEIGDPPRAREDRVATEEPMEIRVVVEDAGRRQPHALSVTMRTPGHDFELAAGFLLSEAVIAKRADIWRVARCEETEESRDNVVEVYLAPGVEFDPERFRRNVYTTSSCGICGKASLELLDQACPRRPVGNARILPGILKQMPERLREAQTVFAQTGGLHGAGLFRADGELLLLREDVGRHNALDKLIGTFFLEDRLPLSDTVLLVSGRASFELVQKTLMAGIPALCAVGAPSSLAVETACEFGQTLVGFLSKERFNVYSGSERLDYPRG